MNDREKLIDLLDETVANCMPNECLGDIADHLLANGVTVQRWIPVTERLPEMPGYYLTWWHGHSCPEGMCDVLNFDGTVFPWETLFQSCKNTVTHWMPQPEPPKEGAK